MGTEATTHGWIWVRQVRVEDASIGVYDHEHHIVQPIELDVGMWTHTAKAAASDALRDTVDWAAVYDTILAVTHSRHFRLTETLCEALAAAILNNFAAQRVRVEVRKVSCLPSGTAAVAIERSK